MLYGPRFAWEALLPFCLPSSALFIRIEEFHEASMFSPDMSESPFSLLLLTTCFFKILLMIVNVYMVQRLSRHTAGSHSTGEIARPRCRHPATECRSAAGGPSPAPIPVWCCRWRGRENE